MLNFNSHLKQEVRLEKRKKRKIFPKKNFLTRLLFGKIAWVARAAAAYVGGFAGVLTDSRVCLALVKVFTDISPTRESILRIPRSRNERSTKRRYLEQDSGAVWECEETFPATDTLRLRLEVSDRLNARGREPMFGADSWNRWRDELTYYNIKRHQKGKLFGTV